MVDKTGAIRNFVVAGHSGSGKTSLCDLMLYKAGAVTTLGSVEAKTSISDYTADEKEKQSSIYATALNCEWTDHHLYFMDTPGYGEFVGESIGAFNACGNTLIVINGEQGLEVGSTQAKNMSIKLNLPRFIFINNLDSEDADFDSVLSQLQDVYGESRCVPMTLPIMGENGIEKVVHLLQSKDFPIEMAEDIAKYKELLLDIVAESDEQLMERYLSGEELSEAEISAGLHDAIHSGSIVPIFAGSVTADVGIDELMNGIVHLFMSPLSHGKLLLKNDTEIEVQESGDGLAMVFRTIQDPFMGQITCFRVLSGHFKADSEIYNLSTGTKERLGSLIILDGKEHISTEEVGPGVICAVTKLKNTHIGNTFSTSLDAPELHQIEFPEPLISYAVLASQKGEDDKVSQGLSRLCECDPTLRFKRNKETGEAILSGMGDLHIRNAITKLSELYKTDVQLTSPKIAYHETITSSGAGQHRHKKQSGGHGQFAEVHLKVEPNETGFEFINKIVGGSIPKNFIPAVEKGVEEAMMTGPLVGCTVDNITVTVYDGKFHAVDSSEMAFKIAARTALHEALESAKPIIQEPLMEVRITIPDQYMGDVTGDLSHKRGRILGMSLEDGLEVVEAEVPLAEMGKYATELRSLTHGQGAFSMTHSRYEPVPTNVTKKVQADFKNK